MKMRSGYNIYVKVTPMAPETLQEMGAEWDDERGWFDELMKIDQRRSADEGWPWTNSRSACDADEHSNSYIAMDFADWDPQHERDRSLTMEPSEAARLDEEIERIVEVREIRDY
jgi:hypothetical protein